MIATRRVQVVRSFLVREVQLYTLDIPTDLDPYEDFAAFDEFVCQEAPVAVEYESIDDDELRLDVEELDREMALQNHASALPMEES